MKFNFTKEHLAQMIKHKNNDEVKVQMWFNAMADIFPKYNIDTPYRIAGFVAQCAHESAKFTRLEENLNYSENSLKKNFSRYFGSGKSAKDYARKPEKIANYVYMDKYRSKNGALGNIIDGDGWKFRGRGLKQLTGRNNYAAFGKSMTPTMSADQAVAYVATEKGAIESACWFWNKHRLNDVADICDIKRMTKVINGGTIGLKERTELYDAALKTLGYTPRAAGDYYYKTLKKGLQGKHVKAVQIALGITNADGAFGSGTRKKVEEFQTLHNVLPIDGIAGPKTLTAIYAAKANMTPPVKLSTQPTAKLSRQNPVPAGIVGATNVTLQYRRPILFSAEVKTMQTALGIKGADGKFGTGTKNEVIAFQKANGLPADGKAGPMTLKKLYKV